MGDPVHAALVGAGGYAAAKVVPFIPSFRNVRYVAVCDANLETARKAAAAVGAETATADLGEVLARPDIDYVELQVPNFLHADLAVRAFEAGKHVLSQKPMARTLGEAQRMIRAGREASRMLGIYMDGYNDPWHWDLRDAVRAGLIGRPVGFRIRYAHQGGLALAGEAWRRNHERVGGGCFLLLIVHLTNAVAWMLDTRITRVTGFMKTLLADMEGDDSTAGALELANGLIGAVDTSYVADGSVEIPNTVLELRGTEGAIRHQRDDGVLYVYSKKGTFKGRGFTYDRPGETLRYERDVEDYMHPTVQERFAAAIRGGEPYVCPGETGLRDLAVCLAMEESSRAGRAVDIDAFIGREP
jgi:1,5-anhydro-D-fructose reductase (1,5-anhydro-D-mannitol-forming)